MLSNPQKTLWRAGALALLLSSVAACGQTATTAPTDTSMATTPEPTTPQMPAIAPVSTADFIQKAAISDMFEIQAAQLAETRGNTAVKPFARQMVTDHRASTAALRTALQGQAGLPALPTALDADHQNMLNDLRNANAAEFDQKYVDNQTHAHQDALRLMQNYAQNGDNAALKTFASNTAPTVQHHLDMIQNIDHSGADEPSHSNQ
jgi:putative membrane protein